MKPIELSFEFFPPKTAEGVEAARHACAAAAAEAEIRVLHVRRRRFDAAGHARYGARHAEGRPRGRAAPVVHRFVARQPARDPDQYRSYGIRHIVALRGDLPSGMGEVGELRYASGSSASSAPSTATGSTSRWPAIRSTTRRRARRRPISKFRAQGESRREFRDHAVLLQRRRVFPLRRRCAQAGRGGADRAGHHADHELLAADAFLRDVRRRSAALGRAPARELRRRSRVDPRVRRGRRHEPVPASGRRGRAGSAFLYAEHGGRDADDL